MFIYNGKILYEELLEIDSKYNESLLFSIDRSKKSGAKFILGEQIAKYLKKDDKQYYEFVARATPENITFLQESMKRNIRNFSPAYNWFKSYLRIISPHSAYADLEVRLATDSKFNRLYNLFLTEIDTGIKSIDAEFGEITESDEKYINKDEDISQALIGENRFTYYKNKSGDIRKVSVITERNNDKGESVSFKLPDESDGTARILDLMPILALLEEETQMTFIIDEIDRSLHPLLIKKLIQMHNEHNSGKPIQLIFTTHETYLLDLNILRKDEIYFIEKNLNCTSLYSLYDFQPRYDKDIRKDYLLGKFGAIPFIGEPNFIREGAD